MNRSLSSLSVSALVIFSAGCSGTVTGAQALSVSVGFEPGAASTCARVIATPSVGAAASTGPLARKDALRVAVYRADGWSEDVTLVARGYVNCDAASANADDFLEQSEPHTQSFGSADSVSLLIKKKAVLDEDGDGQAPGDGDCNDADATIYAGAPEACSSTKDNNCSGAAGCADATCQGACEATGTGSCQAGVCVGPEAGNCGDGVDNDLDGRVDCLDLDCTARSCSDGTACTTGDTCRADGGCSGQPITLSCGSPPGVCFTAGTCNPADGGCLFPVRDAGTPCNDSNACTQGTTCQPDGVCGSGTPAVTCNTPPGFADCVDPAGTCNPADGGCTYAPKANGTFCSDGKACIEGDRCDGDGGCVGTGKFCTPPVCKSGGTCTEPNGTCTFTNAASGGACDDGNVCTVGTTCNGVGGCAGGSQNPCTTLDLCQVPTGCDPVLGCQYGPKCVATECQQSVACAAGICSPTNKPNGTGCSGAGVCQSGICTLPFTPFDSTTPASNFNADGGVPRVQDLIIDCQTTFDTGAQTFGVATLSLCDGGTLSSADGGIEFVNQTTGPQVALLRVAALNVSSAGVLNVNGSKPLILAVYGDATVAGSINAAANGTTKGPGADNGCTAAGSGGNPGGQSGSGGGGGAYVATGGPGGTNGNVAGFGAAGQATGSPGITPLRGGCTGGNGGVGDPSTVLGGLGGGGGGAVQLTASGTLRLSGTLNVNGGGGRGGDGQGKGAGGGGGGSAGAILLEARSVRISSTARLLANGGAGGEGGRDGNYKGVDGPDGVLAYGRTAAPAGASSADGEGGDGGGGNDGTLFGTSGTNGDGSNRGGGGGGGTAGRIRLNFPSTADACRQTNYLFTPSSNATNGNTNVGFTSSATLPGTSTCP